MINIAVCDDDLEITKSINKLLMKYQDERDLDFTVDLFNDGSGLKSSILKGKKYDLIYLDIEMRQMNGIATELNKIGGANGIGIVDIVENRVVGMKSRGVYETPGGTILMAAHKQLEELILDRDSMAFKKTVDNRFADIVYEGKWFTPLCDSLRAYIKASQEYVTGTANLKLYKGNIIKQGTTSPYSLYNESIASFATGDMYDHHDAEGFINLFGLSLKVRAMKLAEAEKKK